MGLQMLSGRPASGSMATRADWCNFSSSHTFEDWKGGWPASMQYSVAPSA